MKLLRYGPRDEEKPGVLDDDGHIRDLSSLLPDITPKVISPEGLSALRRLNLTQLPIVRSVERLGIPYRGVGKVICVGLNYRDHARETGQAMSW